MANFYDEIVALKNLIRSGYKIRFGEIVNQNGDRLESDGEHIFSSTMLALKIVSDRKLNINVEKLLKMLLFHEMGEIDAGDITPIDNVLKEDKFKKEQAGVCRVSKVFDMPEIMQLWSEFEEAKTKEARLAKVVDRLDGLLQVKRYAKKYNKMEVYQEFLERAKDKIIGYEEYLED